MGKGELKEVEKVEAGTWETRSFWRVEGDKVVEILEMRDSLDEERTGRVLRSNEEKAGLGGRLMVNFIRFIEE